MAKQKLSDQFCMAISRDLQVTRRDVLIKIGFLFIKQPAVKMIFNLGYDLIPQNIEYSKRNFADSKCLYSTN